MIKSVFLLFITFLSLSLHSQDSVKSSLKKDSTIIYYEKANLYKNNGYFSEAIINAKKAIDFSKNNGNKEKIAISYFTLSTIYLEIKNYDNAIENLLRTISSLNNTNPNNTLALSYTNLGICYLQKNDFEKSEIYLKKAISVYDSIKLPFAKNLVNLKKGIILLEKKKRKEAKELFRELIELKTSAENNQVIMEAYIQLGKISRIEASNEIALEYFLKAYKLSKENKEINHQIEISKLLSSVYEKLQDSKISLFYLKRHIFLRDSLFLVLKKNKLNLETFKAQDNLLSFEKMSQDKKQKEKDDRFRDLVSILSIALITILSLLSLSLYKNNIIRNKSNEMLQEKNTELEVAKERTEKASKARAEFLSTVSHELRTPLNAINGISHILLEDKPKKRQIEYLKSLKFSGNYLLTYINEILEINRIESDNIEVENIPFNFRELLYNIQNSLKEIASKNNNDFDVIIDPKIPEVLIGDTTKLSQIFINLINNALKFTINGTITVSSELLSTNGENCHLRFNIIDTGIGIHHDKKDTIFESFSQGSVEINRKYGGTGLGLSIVKRLVNLMKGEINVISEIGAGSTFTFELEFKIGENIDDSVKHHIIDESIFENKRILLVEDNKINQMITKKFLTKKLMKCEISETGEDAIEKVRNNDYDLVLMDVHLPGINGTIATEEIRKFNSDITIIALTAISLNENKEMLLSYGIDEVITKPFNPDHFYKVIEGHLLKKTNTVG